MSRLDKRIPRLAYNTRNLIASGSTDRIDHIARLVGIEHAGIGTDADLTEGLIRRGYSDDNIRAVPGENFHRALGEIWVA